jgi:hypothetical protein
MVKKLIAREFLIAVSIIIISLVLFAMTKIYIKNILSPQAEKRVELNKASFKGVSKSELKTLDATKTLFSIIAVHSNYGFSSGKRYLQILKYGDNLDSFVNLLFTNDEVVQIAYELFKGEGYRHSIKDFNKLIGKTDDNAKARSKMVCRLETRRTVLEKEWNILKQRGREEWRPFEGDEYYSYITWFLIILFYPLRGLMYALKWSIRTIGSSTNA